MSRLSLEDGQTVAKGVVDSDIAYSFIHDDPDDIN